MSESNITKLVTDLIHVMRSCICIQLKLRLLNYDISCNTSCYTRTEFQKLILQFFCVTIMHEEQDILQQ